jgi:predicted secreted protein
VPTIPDWIKNFRHQGFTNVFELEGMDGLERLYATETLYGDWDGKVLLLAKDAAPAHVIRNLCAAEGNSGWRHAQRDLGDEKGWRTNERLSMLVAQNLPGIRSLYGSAAAHMMSDNPSWSRALPALHHGPLQTHLMQTLRWVLDEMRNCSAIACLGGDAWRMACNAFGAGKEAKSYTRFRDSETVLEIQHHDRSIGLTCHYHPSARVSNANRQRGWVVLSSYLSNKAQ